MAPILHWIKVAWRDGERLEGETTLDDLGKAWKEAGEDRRNLFTKGGKRRWTQVRGPIGALALSLDRLGWHTNDGLHFTDDKGETRAIDSFSPACWAILLKQSGQRSHEWDLGTRTGYPDLRGKRVCIDIVKRVSRASRTS